MKHPSTRFIAALGLCAGLVGGTARAQTQPPAQPTPVGVWKTVDDKTGVDKSLLRITESAGVLTGKIDKLLDPARPPDAVCLKCTDDRKDKPLLGMTVLRNVSQNADNRQLWDGGEILDPEDGQTYKVRLTTADAGKRLDVRGYIGMPLLGRTQRWVRVE